MITLSLEENKVITIAMVPYTPSQEVIEMAAATPDDVRKKEEFDKVKMIPQLQILTRHDKELVVEASALLTNDELMSFLLIGKSVGMSLKEMESVVDKHFDGYREYVLRKSREAANGGQP